MTAQILEIAGQKMAVLPIGDYERLLELVEDQSDIRAADAAERRRLDGEEYVPVELVDRLINGENALKVWREYRGLSQRKLAEVCNAREATISEIESGKAQGKPTLWRALARALNVSVDDILPLD
jgi:DNA-binding XRE family transcriptional regulator